MDPSVLSADTFRLIQTNFHVYLETIFGLKSNREFDEKFHAVIDLLLDIRKAVRTKKDFATSDKIRDTLNASGIIIRDEKDGKMSWDVV